MGNIHKYSTGKLEEAYLVYSNLVLWLFFFYKYFLYVIKQNIALCGLHFLFAKWISDWFSLCIMLSLSAFLSEISFNFSHDNMATWEHL